MAATLDTSSAEAMRESLRRQKDMLDALRAENKDLRASLAQSNRGVTTASPVAGGSMAHQRREAEHIQSKLFSLRRSLDATKAHNDERAKEIGRLQEKLDELRVEARPLLSEQSPIAQKIRALENRLDKALIKHNEALAIRRTYEQIVKRLQEERVGFDNQLAAIEKTLKSKEHDYAELQNMAHDAHHAKEIARAEVAQFKAAYAEERRAKKKELEERKQYVQAQMEKTLKQERAAKAKQQRQAAEDGQAENSNGDDARGRRDAQATSELRTEEEEERLRHLEAAYRRMRDATRATNVDGVIAAYEEQQDTKQSLEATVKEAQRSIERLQQQRTELKRKLEDAKFGGGAGLLGSRRIVDEFETHLTEARANRNKALQNFERVAGVMVGVMAGIEHLVEKLSTFQKEPGERPKVTEKDLVKALSYCDSTLENVMGAGQADVDNAARHMDLVEVKLPVHNVRIALSKRGDDDHDGPDATRTRADAEDADDDPHTRESLKAMTKSTVDREDKKARKRGRKKDDEN